MSGKVVNLRTRRRAKARDEKRLAAAGNAARHGRTKKDRASAEAERDRAARHLDGHKRDE